METLPDPPAADAVILAGGAGRRMGGQDKGLLMLHGQALVRHVAAALEPGCRRVWIAARNVAAYRALGFAHVVDDGPYAGAGPLAGLLAALRCTDAPALVAAPCDVPLLPRLVPERLRAALRWHAAAFATRDGHDHYACLAVRADLREALAEHLAAGERKVQAFLERADAARVDFSDCPGSFLNVNTPQDLAAAEAALTGAR